MQAKPWILGSWLYLVLLLDCGRENKRTQWLISVSSGDFHLGWLDLCWGDHRETFFCFPASRGQAIFMFSSSFSFLLGLILFFQAFSRPYYLSECLTISSIIITMLYNYLNPWLSPFQRPETSCVLHVHSQHLAGDTGMRCLFNNYLSKEKKTVNEWVKKLFTLLFYSLG